MRIKLVNALVILGSSLMMLVPAFGSEQHLEPERCFGFVSNGELDASHFTVMGFTLGKHSIGDIQDKLGLSRIVLGGKHETDRCCYISNSRKSMIVFESYFEKLTGFRVVSEGGDFGESDKCTRCSNIPDDVGTERGIKLGMSRSQLENLLGKPTKTDNGKLVYSCWMKRKMSDKEIAKLSELWPNGVRENPFFDINIELEAVFSKSRLESFSIFKTETY